MSFRTSLLSGGLWVLLASLTVFAQRPDIVVQMGHISSVNSVVFSPNGRALASVSNTFKALKIWDVETGRVLRTLAGHSEGINTVAFSPDGKFLASGSDDKTIKLWDISSGREIRTLPALTLRITCLAFHPDGSILAGAGYDNHRETKGEVQHETIKLWDVATGRELRSIIAIPINTRRLVVNGNYPTQRVNSIAFSPDGKALAVGSDEGTIRIWNPFTGREIGTLEGHSDRVNSIAFSPNGHMLASASGNFSTNQSPSHDSTIRLWDLRTFRLLRTLTSVPREIKSVAFSPDDKTLASVGGTDEKIVLWDPTNGNKISSLSSPSNSDMECLAFSPDGKLLAVGSYDNAIELWDLKSNRLAHLLTGHSTGVTSVAFSPDTKTVASANLERQIQFWSAANQEFRTVMKDSSSFAFSPDGRRFAEFDGEKISLWDRDVSRDTAREISVPREDKGKVDPIVFSPDSKILAGVNYDGWVRLWNISSGRELRTLKGKSFKVESVAFSADGSLLAGGGYFADSRDGFNIKLWDVATGRELRTFAGHSFRCDAVAFSPANKALASGGLDNAVKLWDPSTGHQLLSFTGHTEWITSVAFSPDGKILASASMDKTVRLWDPSTGREIRKLTGHTEDVRSIAFSSDGRMLVSGSFDGSLKIWQVEDGKELASLVSIGENDWLIVTPDGLFDGSPVAWNQILWRFNGNTFDVASVEAFFNEYYYPGLLTEILSGEKILPARDISQIDRRQPILKLEGDTSLPNTETIDSRNALVKIEIIEAGPDKVHPNQGSGARDVRLFRNGSLVKVWRGEVKLESTGKTTLEATIPIVEGENRLTAYAFNHDNVKSSDATLVITGAESLKRAGTLYLLAIGINRYGNSQFDLKYAVPDAQAFGEELQRQQAGLSRYSQVVVVPLLDQDASKANILLALKRLAGEQTEALPTGVPKALGTLQHAQPEDAVVVYFAGHGTAQQARFYLIPQDLGYQGARASLNASNLETILTHSISDIEIEQAFEGIDAGSQLLVVDACNSGQALEAEEKRRGPMNSKGLAQLAYEKGMYILTAAQSYQSAIGSARLGHGYLTFALVEEGLKTEAADTAPKDGQVLIREWLDYATRRVPQMQDQAQEARELVQQKATESPKTKEPDELQRPRVFYRRELEPQPMVVAKTRQP